MTTTRGPAGKWIAASATALVAVGGLVAVGCGGDSASGTDTAAAAGATRAVVSFSILDDVVRNVGGDCVDTTVLVNTDGDAHVFEPTPKDATALKEADVVISNGLGFEPWLADLYSSSGSAATQVVTMSGVTPIEGADDHADEGGAKGDDTHEVDPHAWQDPANMREAVAKVRDALVAANPECAPRIRENAARYDAKLVALDAEIVSAVKSVPRDERIIITNHDSLGYFAKRYGFGVETALGSVTTESADPSAQQIASLADDIKKDGVKAIFVENIGGSSVIDRLATEAGVQVAPPLYTDVLGEQGSAGATYLGMMKANAQTISTALSGS